MRIAMLVALMVLTLVSIRAAQAIVPLGAVVAASINTAVRAALPGGLIFSLAFYINSTRLNDAVGQVRKVRLVAALKQHL
jgi:hypothetical protein